MSATQDYVALDWIKGEISETLAQAQTALEAASEAPDDSTNLRACLTSIHQVHGTLKMLQLTSPVQIAAEMEELAQALMSAEVPDVGHAQEMLMQSILQMPSLLDRIQRDQTDSDSAVRPLINNLRSARGAELLESDDDEVAPASVDLSPFTDLSKIQLDIFEAAGGTDAVGKLASRYRGALAALLKKTKPRDNIRIIAQVLNRLVKLTGGSPTSHLASVGVAVMEGVNGGGIRLDNNLAHLLRDIDRHHQTVVDQGLSVPVDETLVVSLLEVVAGATKATARIEQVRDRYLTAQESSSSITLGPDEETVAAVAGILMEELRAITDKLDLFVRTSEREVGELVALLPQLEQVSSTLQMVSLDEHQQSVQQQMSVIRETESSSGALSEDQLLEMAGAFLQIESVLAAMLGEEDGEESIGDVGEAAAVVVRETRSGLATCKDALIDYVSNSFDVSHIVNLSDDLMALQGSLAIINQQQCGDILRECAAYVRRLIDEARQPELSEMDDLADAITSIDYFLERYLENPSEPYLQMVEVARAAMDKLPSGGADLSAPDTALDVIEESADETAVVGLTEQDEVAQAPLTDVDAESEQPDGNAEVSMEELFPEVGSEESDLVTDAEPAAAEASPAREQATDLPEVDDEIIEIFIEEAGEVLETLQEYFPQWRSTPGDADALAEIRRAFHTLKGSGRMVGATVMGELAWAVENMLNRVIDETIATSDSLFDVVEKVIERIPEGISTFADGRQETFVVQDLAAQADTLSEGGTLTTDSPMTASVDEMEADQQTDANITAAEDAELLSTDAGDAEEIDDVSVAADLVAEEHAEEPLAEEPLADEVVDVDEASIDELSIDELSLETLSIEDDASLDALDVDEIDSALQADETSEVPEELSVADDIAAEEPEEEAAPPEPDTLTIASGSEVTEIEQDLTEESLFDEELDAAEADQANVSVSAPPPDSDSLDALADVSEEFDIDVVDIDVEPEVDAASESSPDMDLHAEEGAVEEDSDTVEEIILSVSDFETDADDIESESEDSREEASADPLFDLSEFDEEDFEIEEISLDEPLTYDEEDGVDQTPDVTLEDEIEIDVDESPGTEESELSRLERELVLEEEPVVEEESELDVIFRDEARGRLSTIRRFVEGESELSDDVVAAFHTLKGTGAVADVPQVSSLAAPLEAVAAKLQAGPGERHAPFVELVTRALPVIERIIEHLSELRYNAPGMVELIEEANQMLLVLADTSAGAFDFGPIELLGHAYDVLIDWDPDVVAAMRKELENAGDQAARTGQSELLALTSALLDVHLKMGLERPSDDALRVIGTAHEQLILMFDQIAASQDVRGAPSAISLLKSLDLDAATDIEGPTGQAVVTLPEDDIDQDILAIFLEEAEELQLAIDASIHGWSRDPGKVEHRDDLLRHLHTMKGSARLAGLNSLGEYTHNMETEIDRQDIGTLDDAFFAALNEQQDEVSRRVAVYQKLSVGAASKEELQSLLTVTPVAASTDAVPPVPVPPAAVDSTPMSLPEDDIDADILPIFMEEAEELLEGIDHAILDWSGAPDNSEYLDLLLRHLHTLKGGARLAGLNSLGEYTHHFETRLIEQQQHPGPLNDTFFNDVHARQDEITRRFEIYQQYAAGEVGAEALAEMTVVTEAIQAAVATSTPAPPALRDTGDVPAEAEMAPQVQSEVIRVQSDLLASLISMAGESSITRGRVEQQIRDFGESLEEMEETIARIRDHVRQLEIEAESRETVFRTRTPDDADAQSAFDDLEMDRYTMLQEVSRVLSEGASDMMDLKDTLVDKSRDAETMLHQQARINRELQEGLTRTRMEPFARLIPRLRRIVRQISTEVGKSVKFDAFNVEGELDRNVLDRIVAPLEHMLRNAVDHGIESPEDRHAAGKPEQGRISLRLDREGGYVVLTVSDDGGGINVDAVRKKAIERGLIDDSGIHTDHDVMQFIMHAGFSTAQQVTQISGRGVGMDVVASEIKSLGGTITIDSTAGVGTEFTIRLPFTVSINRALMVVVAEETYAVPLNTIEGIVRVSPYELEAYYQPENAPMYEYAGQPYRLEYMGKMLGRSDDPNLDGQVAQLPVILARSGDDAVALQVDRVIGSREVVVKSLGPQFGEVGGVTGATVLGDGSVVVILDVMALVQSEERRHETPLPKPEAPFENMVKTVMIVDDSVTVRKVTSRLMERNGFDVLTAKDGVDAINQLQDVYPSIVLLDIEMPRMDGFEVLRTVRRDERLKDLPIIMITSRTGGKHQQQAEELGVNRYLGKPFQEAVLMETINEVMAETERGG